MALGETCRVGAGHTGVMQLDEEFMEPAEPRSLRRQRRIAPTREARTARRLLWLIPTATVALAFGTRLVVTSEAVSREFAAFIASELANRTRSAVQLSGVTFGLDFAPCFQDFEIYRYHGPYKIKATTKQACVERWASAVGSGFHAIRIRLDEPSISCTGSQEAARARAFVDVKPEIASSTTTEVRRAALREIQVLFDDLRLDWERMPFPERFARGTFGPIDGTVTVQIRGGRTAATLFIREPSTGTAINGRINPTSLGWDMSASVEGDLVPIFGTFLKAAELDIRRMPTRGRIGAIYASKRRALTVDLDLEQYDVDLKNALVSANRLVGFSAHEQARANFDLDRSILEVEDGLVEVNGIPVVFSLKIAPGEGTPRFDIRADLRTIPLVRLLLSVPDAQEPAITRDVSPSVQFALSFSMSGNLRDPLTWQPKLEHRISGIGPNGEGSGLEILKGTFRYYPLTSRGRSDAPRLIGPDSASWQPFARIPYLERRAVIVSEDSTFFFHNGIEIAEIQNAIRQAIETGEKTRGGSTLTQQLVKNLFLTRDRTALRKLQEALLTFHIESVLTKEQIFELYMNIIEWGPDVYGLKEAAWHYFAKKPEALNVREMAYLATIIPSPIRFHSHYENGRVPPKHGAKVDGLLERLHRLGQLSDPELARARETKIRFARRKKAETATDFVEDEPDDGEEETP